MEARASYIFTCLEEIMKGIKQQVFSLEGSGIMELATLCQILPYGKAVQMKLRASFLDLTRMLFRQSAYLHTPPRGICVARLLKDGRLLKFSAVLSLFLNTCPKIAGHDQSKPTCFHVSQSF